MHARVGVLGLLVTATVCIILAGPGRAQAPPPPPPPPPTPEIPTGSTDPGPSDVATTTVTEPVVTREVGKQVISELSKQIVASVRPGGIGTQTSRQPGGRLSGLSAGNGEPRWGVWGSVSWQHIDLDVNPFDGDLVNGLVGFDYRLNDNVILGMAVGYESNDITTTFNNGSFDSKGPTIAVYGSYIFNEFFFVDAILAYSRLDIDQDSRLTSTRTSSSTNSNRYLASAGLNTLYTIESWTLSGRISYLYGREVVDAFTDSAGTRTDKDTIEIGIGQIGGRVEYAFELDEGRTLIPFLGATFEYDIKEQDASQPIGAGGATGGSSDRSALVALVGMDARLSDRWRATFEANRTFLRDDFDAYGVALRMRTRF